MGRRARYLLSGLVLLVVAGASLAWWLTKPDRWDAAHWEGLGEPDLANGEQIFWAGGCVSCHSAPGPRTTRGSSLPAAVPEEPLRHVLSAQHLPR